MRTQATRWLAANRGTLTAEQLAAAEEAIAIITPDLYRLDRPAAERHAVAQAVTERLSTRFTREQIWRFVGAGAPYIPPS